MNLRMYNLDPAPAQDMAGLQITYGYDMSEMNKANEMLKMGQVPMDSNAMPGLVEDMSDAEALVARNLVTRRGIAGSLMNGRGRILTGSMEVTLVMPVPVPQFCVSTVGTRVIFHGNVEENGETREGKEMAVLEADK